MAIRTPTLWIAWLLGTVVVGGVLGYQLTRGEDRSAFLIGETSSGHHQIELACEACHAEPFGGGEVLQDACESCHAEELEQADDSHPRSKFTDPRNADRVAVLDARYCVTCHVEHRPEQTRVMGVTLPTDFCFYCHQDIGEERPSHQGMGFETCASAGCHNFHDNRALYEDFLVKHAHDGVFAGPGMAPELDHVARVAQAAARALAAADAQAPSGQRPAEVVRAWEHSAHAAAGVDCQACHQPRDAAAWVEAPATTVCADCHAPQHAGWQAGKHGMRGAQGLPPMQPVLARQPMHPESLDRELDCVSCHGPHAVDTRVAAVEACLDCHADEHSLAFQGSPHHRLWERERSGEAAAGTGVSCATCHMPREAVSVAGQEVVIANHNQNANLRPGEKMIRPVCMSCHGLGFAIDALADPALVRGNFHGQPARHVQSIEMAVSREAR